MYTSLTVTMLLLFDQTNDKRSINELPMTKKTKVITHDGSKIAYYVFTVFCCISVNTLIYNDWLQVS